MQMKRLLSKITSPFRVILLFLWCNPETVACERVLFSEWTTVWFHALLKGFQMVVTNGS